MSTATAAATSQISETPQTPAGDSKPDEQTDAEKKVTYIDFDNSRKPGEGPEDETLFRNLYRPNVTITWDKKDSAGKTFNLDDNNITAFLDVTRIGWKRRVDYAALEVLLEEKRKQANKDEVCRDPNHLLGVALTTVMCLAMSAYDIPQEYYMYTELYLRNVKDHFGYHPPNILKLLQHLKYIKDQNNINWGEPVPPDLPEGLVVAKLTPSKIPRRCRHKGDPPCYKGRRLSLCDSLPEIVVTEPATETPAPPPSGGSAAPSPVPSGVTPPEGKTRRQ